MGDFVFAQVVANARAEEQDKRQRKASKAERQRIKQLERELQYRDGEVQADSRPTAARLEPANKLSAAEQQAVLTLCNNPHYRSCPPAFIVADQLDQGRFLASESTMYRLLRTTG